MLVLVMIIAIPKNVLEYTRPPATDPEPEPSGSSFSTPLQWSLGEHTPTYNTTKHFYFTHIARTPPRSLTLVSKRSAPNIILLLNLVSVLGIKYHL